jgi:two-component system, LytTR family, response regulator
VVIQTVIADDEALARQKLRVLLRQEPDIQVIGEAASPSEIIALVQSKKPDLLFLDICMPAKNGLDVVAELSRDKSIGLPHIIITTAHGEYAVRAFEMRAADYLLKPYTAERLHSALQYARERINNNALKGLPDGRTASNAGSPPARIVFKSRGRILFLPITEIRWIAAEENYVRICTANESHLLRETMAGMESKLDSQMFMRVHRSAIVNLKYVKEVRREGSGDFSVLLSNGQRVAMSRSHHSNIDSLIARL